MTLTTQPSRLGLLHRAGWLLVLYVTVAVGLPTPHVAAADTICVALVVDFSPLGGNVDSGCTKVPSGANGYDVLRAGGHRYGICGNGIIGTIDGQPANGCQIKDKDHYWGYWHRKPGSSTWTFSNYGAGGYHPVEGSTEGWVWENGSTSPPANVPYPTGCHSPPSSPSPSPAPRTTSSSTAAGTTSAAATAGAGSASRPSRSEVTTAAARRHAAARARARASANAPGTPTPTPPSSQSASPTARASTAGSPRSTTASGDSRQTAPVLAGVGIAALLGGGAWWRFRKPAMS
ncbi:MAG TPA: hypothetical protein VFJ17_08435 [Mycobacteriales bacterium]|jgi:hypothetical protein|nr:hypothetical protein [Mycobacteriales bacterium]